MHTNVLPLPISLCRDSPYTPDVMSVPCPIPSEPPVSADSQSGIQPHCQCMERTGFDSRCSATPRTPVFNPTAPPPLLVLQTQTLTALGKSFFPSALGFLAFLFCSPTTQVRVLIYVACASALGLLLFSLFWIFAWRLKKMGSSKELLSQPRADCCPGMALKCFRVSFRTCSGTWRHWLGLLKFRSRQN